MNLSKKTVQVEDVFFAALSCIGLLFIFYPQVFLIREAPLVGDHWQQHFPWAFYFSELIKSGKIPFWTSQIHCGFPLAAESQIGVFYLPNLLLYRVMEIKAAYALTFLIHSFFVMLGTYLYAKSAGLDRAGAMLSAIIFTFGAGYGGAYYNITSLKTITWFPWLLYAIENLSLTIRKRYVLLVIAGIFQSLVAGYLQVAILMLGIVAIYFFLHLFFLEITLTSKVKLVVVLGFAGAIGLVFAAPQILLTFQLAMESTRSSPDIAYAYVGSLSPAALGTYFFPRLQGLFRGNSLYAGILPIFFIFVAASSSFIRKQKKFKLWGIIAILSLFLALGKWSPLYVLLVKITQFSSFRTPSKFIIFLDFALAMLAGIGLQYWLAKPNDGASGDASSVTAPRLFIKGIAVVLAVAAIVYLFLYVGGRQLHELGVWWVQKDILNQPGHPHSFEVYLQKLDSYLEFAKSIFSLSDNWMILSCVFLLFSGFWAWSSYARKVPRRILLISGFLLIVIDLYVFSRMDIYTDFDSFQKLEKSLKIVDYLQNEKEKGNLGRVYQFKGGDESSLLVPSANMLYGIPVIGAYSPLVKQNYLDSIGLFGDVNDSNLSYSADEFFLFKHIHLLQALGVSHVLSPVSLSHESLKMVYEDSEKKERVYRFDHPLENVFFAGAYVVYPSWKELSEKFLEEGFDPRQLVLLEENEKFKRDSAASLRVSGTLREIISDNESERSWQIKIDNPGFFIWMETYHPGWEVRVNGARGEIVKVYGLFQGVWLPNPGEYVLDFRYSPAKAIERTVKWITRKF